MSAQQLDAIKHFFKRPSRRLITALVIFGALFGPGVFDLACIMAKQHKLDQQLADLASRKEQLASEQKRLESDPGYMEGLIRSTFKWSHPGELVVPLSSKNSLRNSKRLASE